MTALKNKKILLVTARFFGYELEIQARLRELGAHVDWYDQRPANTFIVKSLIRIDNRLLYFKIRNYYNRIIRETDSTRYDYVLFISPETITTELLVKMKRTQNGANFVLYMWDSFRNKSKNIKELTQHFNSRYSFDKEDCSIPAYNLKYRPLFFLNEYSKIETTTKYLYDVLFIGTVHSDRFSILRALRNLSSELKLSSFYYMFFPSKILFMLRYLIDGQLRSESPGNFRFVPLKKNEVVDNVSKSRAIVDIQHPNQLGLTIRTIEVLGARRKLITTNADIASYDFYHPQNIKVIDRAHPKIDQAFFETEFFPIENSIYEKYSIDGWIYDVLNLKR